MGKKVAATARMLGISEEEVMSAYRDLFRGSGELYHRTVGDRLARICGETGTRSV